MSNALFFYNAKAVRCNICFQYKCNISVNVSRSIRHAGSNPKFSLAILGCDTVRDPYRPATIFGYCKWHAHMQQQRLQREAATRYDTVHLTFTQTHAPSPLTRDCGECGRVTQRKRTADFSGGVCKSILKILKISTKSEDSLRASQMMVTPHIPPLTLP